MSIGRILRSIVNALTGTGEGPSGPEAYPGSSPATGHSEAGDTDTGNRGGSSPMTQTPAAWLLFQSGSKAGQSVPLEGQTVSIGRSTDNDVVIEDVAMSRTHARISYDDGQYFIEDLGSTSGTLVDGSTVTKTLLTSGGSVKLGETQVMFMQAGPSSVPGSTSGPTSSRQTPAETMMIERPQGMMAWLAITSGPQKGKTYQMKVGDNTIGRDPSNDLALEDPGVSRSHALIKAQEGNFLLMDLGSRGGGDPGRGEESGEQSPQAGRGH